MKQLNFLIVLSLVGLQMFGQNVGIGTTTPVQKLHVEGSTYLNGNLGIGASTPVFPISFGPALGDKISLWSNSTNSYGFGIQSSQLQIHTDISAADIVFGYGSSAAMTERMRIKGNGLVGIGTSTPLEKLQVAGNIKADTVKPNAIRLTPNAGSGRVLTSDASGNASWQERNGTVGFGSWGDCSMNGISEYNPVADPAGETVDHFGFSVSISGNFAIIGTPYDDLTKGSASIYQYNGSNWVFMQKLTDATGVSGDLFGNSVSISGNYAIAGAPYATNGGNIYQGAVCIFQFNGSNWVLMQKITDPAGAAGDLFGSSVSVSGIYTVIGAVGDDELTADQGSASVYIYNGSSWLFMQKITDATGASTDFFGTSVSVSNNYIVIGAPSDVVGTNNFQGSASIYQYNGSSWVLMQKITDAGGAANDNFGCSVSISGNCVVMGAYYDNAGQGSVSFYQYNGSSWVLMQKTSGDVSDDSFGTSVSLSGNYAMIGATGDDVGTHGNQGSASIYVRVGAGWQKLQYITDPGGEELNYMGSAAAVDGNSKRFLIGVPDYAFQSGKVVFGKIN